MLLVAAGLVAWLLARGDRLRSSRQGREAGVAAEAARGEQSGSVGRADRAFAAEPRGEATPRATDPESPQREGREKALSPSRTGLRVVDASGQPVSGALVELMERASFVSEPDFVPAGDLRLTTNREGEVWFQPPFAGLAFVRVRADGFVARELDHLSLPAVASGSTGRRWLAEIALDAGMTWEGCVVSPDGEGLGGGALTADIAGCGPPLEQRAPAVTTDERGRFRLTTPAAHATRILIGAREHLAQQVLVEHAAEHEFELERASHLRVHVTTDGEATDGGSVHVADGGGAWLLFDAAPVRVSGALASGWFEASGLDARRPYDVSVAMAADPRPTPLDRVEGLPLSIELEMPTALDIQFVPVARSGSTFHEPWISVDAKVGCCPWIHFARVPIVDGVVTLRDLRESPCSPHALLKVHARGFRSRHLRPTKIWYGALNDFGTVGFYPCAIVDLEVVDAASDLPVVGAEARVFVRDGGSIAHDGLRGTTDLAGRVVLEVPYGVKSEVRVRTDELAAMPTLLWPSVPGAPPHRIPLTRGGTLRVTALDEAGKPLPGAIVRLIDEERELVADWDGVCTACGLTCGVQRLELVPVGRGRAWDAAHAPLPADWPTTSVKVAPDETLEVELRMPPTVVLEGRLEGRAGPVAGGVVRAFPWVEFERFAGPLLRGRPRTFFGGVVTDENGAFRLTELPPGDWGLILESPTQAVPTIVRTRLEASVERATLTLSQRRLLGRVVHEDEPVAGAAVTILLGEDPFGWRLHYEGLRSGELRAFARTDERGEFVLDGLPAEPLRVGVEAPGRPPVASELLEPSGAPEERTTVILGDGGRLVLDLTRAEGESPIDQVSVRLRPADFPDSAGRVLFVTDGHHEIDGLEPGDYLLYVEDDPALGYASTVVRAGEVSRVKIAVR
ncbi:MAG: carboxypeptidase-like regulatory domain-containing protein [Planctomycetota bacterium]